jgi:HPt (histidine-containing phosphotransfer) domain-containing protein
MSFNDIIQELPKLSDDQKRHLRTLIDQELGDESPEFLAKIDHRLKSAATNSKRYSIDEARTIIRDTAFRASR